MHDVGSLLGHPKARLAHSNSKNNSMELFDDIIRDTMTPDLAIRDTKYDENSMNTLTENVTVRYNLAESASRKAVVSL